MRLCMQHVFECCALSVLSNGFCARYIFPSFGRAPRFSFFSELSFKNEDGSEYVKSIFFLFFCILEDRLVAELGRGVFGEDRERSFKIIVDCFEQVGQER